MPPSSSSKVQAKFICSFRACELSLKNRHVKISGILCQISLAGPLVVLISYSCTRLSKCWTCSKLYQPCRLAKSWIYHSTFLGLKLLLLLCIFFNIAFQFTGTQWQSFQTAVRWFSDSQQFPWRYDSHVGFSQLHARPEWKGNSLHLKITFI